MTEKWRNPCVCVSNWAVWYGAAGVDGDCAVEVEKDFLGCIVRKYIHVGRYVDDYDEDKPFLVISTWVEALDVCLAAALGVEKIAHEGGDERFVANLPK